MGYVFYHTTKKANIMLRCSYSVLKLFLYFFELVLRTPCKPHPFHPRETFVFCEETSSEGCESRPTVLNITLFVLAALTSA